MEKMEGLRERLAVVVEGCMGGGQQQIWLAKQGKRTDKKGERKQQKGKNKRMNRKKAMKGHPILMPTKLFMIQHLIIMHYMLLYFYGVGSYKPIDN